jgi:hypothetical protein
MVLFPVVVKDSAMFTQNSRLLKKAFLLSVTTTTALATQLLIASPAKAECEYAGRTYQTGETAGPLVCMADGNMQPQ